MKTLIKGGRVIDPANAIDKIADVLVEDGKIAAVGENLSADGTYDVLQNETEDRHGQSRAIAKLQDLIIANALAKW